MRTLASGHHFYMDHVAHAFKRYMHIFIYINRWNDDSNFDSAAFRYWWLCAWFCILHDSMQQRDLCYLLWPKNISIIIGKYICISNNEKKLQWHRWLVSPVAVSFDGCTVCNVHHTSVNRNLNFDCFQPNFSHTRKENIFRQSQIETIKYCNFIIESSSLFSAGYFRLVRSKNVWKYFPLRHNDDKTAVLLFIPFLSLSIYLYLNAHNYISN